MSTPPIRTGTLAAISVYCLPILTGLAIVYTAYLAQNILLLLLVTALVSLLLAPGVKVLEKLFIPRVIGAALLISLLVVPTSAFVAQLEAPLTKWAKLLPELSAHVTSSIAEIDNAIGSATQLEEQSQQKRSWFSWFGNDEVEEPANPEDGSIIKTRLKETLFSFASDVLVSAPSMLIQFLTMLVLILFSLVFAPKLFRHYVELFVAPDNRDTFNSFAITAQQELSRYILTVSAMNFLLGLASVLFLYAVSYNDALLLGTIMGLLNFIPYVGPMLALGLITIGGLVQWGLDINVVIAVGGVIVLNIIESQFMTPLVLAANLRINPFLIVLWLLLCGWMWGLVGLLIAVPLFVCVKLLLNQYKYGKPWVDFIST
ncbi:AI-2E family transporter [Glaciecola sp. 2405UD65-10]|uniref:AI-2E family transporter n=1 Tax=Glaciecola sp. 2405UD65-10 TaxID=3397244 RepID=UPI003B59657F